MGGFDNNLVNNYYHSDRSGDGSMQDVCECKCVCARCVYVCMCKNIILWTCLVNQKRHFFCRSGNFCVTKFS